MDIKYKISKDEIVNFHISHFSETLLYKSIVVLLYLLYTARVFLDRASLSIIAISMYLIVFFILELLFIKKILCLFFRSQYKKKYSEGSNQYFFEMSSIHIDNNEFIYANSHSKKVYELKSIKEVSILNDYIYIVLKTREEFLIPRKLITEKEDLEKFCKLIKENTNIVIKDRYPRDIHVLDLK